MNEDSNIKLAKQLLAADQAIHEQQLGVQWVRPLEVHCTEVHPVELANMDADCRWYSIQLPQSSKCDRALRQRSPRSSWLAMVHLFDNHHTYLDAYPFACADVDDLDTGHLTAETLRRALTLLCEEGVSLHACKPGPLLSHELVQDFLVEGQFDALLETLEPHERMLLRLDAMFKALSIQTEDDMKQLAMCFIAPEQVGNPSFTKQT